MHMCTHMFANGDVLTIRRQFKVNLVDTNNELLYRSENAFSSCSCLFPLSVNTIMSLFMFQYNDINCTDSSELHVPSYRKLDRIKLTE